MSRQSPHFVGKVHNNLTILEFSHQDEKKNRHWVCKCICGNTKIMSATSLSNPAVKGCGCAIDRKNRPKKIKINNKTRTTEGMMVNAARERSRRFTVPFDITRANINIPLVCPMLGIELIVNKGKKGFTDNSPSLDRRVPELGYVPGNVFVISMRANRMKSNHPYSTIALLKHYMGPAFAGFNTSELLVTDELLDSRMHSNGLTTEKIMFKNAKQRATRLGVPFTLNLTDIVIPERCPLLGIDLFSNKGTSSFTNNSPSLDRRIPELGYTKTNCHIISMQANRIKSDHTYFSICALDAYMSDAFTGF